MSEIYQTLKELLLEQVPPLQVRHNDEKTFEVAGTKPAMQGRQKVDGFYFASLSPKPKDTRFYFFPLYTHPDAFDIKGELKKMLKGKTCFHISKLDDTLITEIRRMIAKGIEVYRENDLV